MPKESCSFQSLPFSSLFKTYVSNYSKLSTFYAADPFDKEDLKQKAANFEFSGDRQQAAKLLKSFNKPFNLHQKALDNLGRLEDRETLVIVTGQQLGLYGGPLYTVFKTISAIHLANRAEALLDRPVVPIFWLADEDHDYDEVRSLHLFNKNGLKQFDLPAKESPLPPVADMKLPEGLQELRDDVKESLYSTDFSDGLWELLDECFQTGHTFSQSFGKFIVQLFSKHGLILAGSNQPDVKQALEPILQKAVSKADALKKALKEQTNSLKEEFHQQVTVYDSNLFYISDQQNRIKISVKGDGWFAGEEYRWSTADLIAEIKENPERFSPNVFLRPIMQDALLPTLGYVAGPGEVAYYGQMKQFYQVFDMEMPIIFPRLSATLIEPAIERIWAELPFEFQDYSQRIEDLESGYVERSEQVDIEAIFKEWKQKVDKVAELQKEKVAEIDQSLEGSAGKATAVYFGELDKLKGKVYRAVKQQDETQLNRIRKTKLNLFPENGLQERLISPIYFMNKFGLDIWDNILKGLDENASFNQHKLINVQ